MDKNTLLGFLMMGAVVFGFMWLNQPSEEEIRAQREAMEQAAKAQAQANEANQLRFDSITPAEAASVKTVVTSVGVANGGVYTLATPDVNLTADTLGNVKGFVKARGAQVSINDLVANRLDSLTLEQKVDATTALRKVLRDSQRYGSFGKHLYGDTMNVVLENDLVKLDLTNKGGIISQATLKNYKSDRDSSLVKLFTPSTASYSFELLTGTQRFNTADFYFTPVQESDTTVLMKLDLGKDAMLGLRYTLRPGSYVATMELVQKGMSSIFPSSTSSVDIKWNQLMARNEIGRTFEERNSGIYYKYTGDEPDYLSEMENDSTELAQRVKWIAFKNQFFSSVMIPRTSFSCAKQIKSILNQEGDYLKNLSAQMSMDYTPSAEKPVVIDFFLGPNSYPLLSDLDDELSPEEDLELTRLIPLGWSLFRWINTLIVIPVFDFLGSFISNYGIIILLLTIFIKLILFPFTYKSYISQAKMRVLAPEIKEINDKYPGNENAMTRQQKTMALYSRAGASPFAGCLPMLLQMPVLIAMFSFFPSCIELRGEAFLWAKDLSAPDVVFTLPFSIPFYGDKVSLFCLLMTITNIVYTKINMQNQPSQQAMPGMKWMMYMMPVMFLFFFNDYAAALSYYYLLSMFITIVQTWIFRKCINEDKVRAQMLANAAKPRKKSGFMARLEEAQRKQQAMLREQQKQQGRRR